MVWVAGISNRGNGILYLFELDVATLRNLPWAIDSVLQFTEQEHHFIARLQVEIGMVPVHPVGVGHGLPRLNAHQNLVRAGIFTAQVMRVVGGDERNASFYGKTIDLGREALVLFQAVVLNLEEEILLAEDVAISVRQAAGVFVFIVEDGFVKIAAQACREADQAFRMGGEQVLIDARLVVKAIKEGRRNHLDEVLVAFLVFAEQDEMVVTVGIGAGLVPLLRNIHFAADNGMDPLRFGGVVEADRAKEVAVIRHSNGGHFLLGDDLHELVDFARAIEQRIVGVVVEVNERNFGHRKNYGSVVGGDDYYSSWEVAGVTTSRV